ncbi:MAG: holo-ACP synthase [Saccharofermentanales bacterium]|jgi:holo-[acyl-carrier protein] synthase|nr:holo-ACP synthase [Clostridiaceae bacterium]
MKENSESSFRFPIIRCGTDLVDINRIHDAVKRLGDPFLNRVFTPQEQRDCFREGGLTHPAAASLAARFAAKEAVAKALGTGFGHQGVAWTEIEIKRAADGSPHIHLSGHALQVFDALNGLSAVISLSHERHMALAFCLLTCSPAEPEPQDVKA